MLFSTTAIALLASVAAATSHFDAVHGPQANTFDYRGLRASLISQRRNLHHRQPNGNQGKGGSTATSASGNAAQTCLDPAAVQTGSASTGQVGTIEAGQVESLTYVFDDARAKTY